MSHWWRLKANYKHTHTCVEGNEQTNNLNIKCHNGQWHCHNVAYDDTPNVWTNIHLHTGTWMCRGWYNFLNDFSTNQIVISSFIIPLVNWNKVFRIFSRKFCKICFATTCNAHTHTHAHARTLACKTNIMVRHSIFLSTTNIEFNHLH